MSNKRRLVDYDEDPEDSDFDIRDSAPARKKVKKTVSGVKSRPKVQKSRGRYKGSDIEEDDEDLDDDDIEDSEADEPSSPVDVNPNTGKPARKAARQQKNYQESDSDEDVLQSKEESDVASPSPPPPSRLKRSKTPSRVVTFRIRSLDRKLRERKTMNRQQNSRRRRSRDSASAEPSSAAPTRRSSRHAHSEERLVSLTDSGRHEREERAGVAEAPSRQYRSRATLGRKGPARTTSTIIEASQEDDDDPSSRPQDAISDITPEDEDEDQPPQPTETTAGYQSGMARPGSATRDPLQDDAEGSIDEEQRVIAESVQGDEDDEDDEPVLNRNQRRSLRSSAAQIAEEPTRRTSQRTGSRRRPQEEGSDFEPAEDEPEDDKISSADERRPALDTQDSETSGAGRRSGRIRSQRTQRRTMAENTEEEDDEIAEEAAELRSLNRRSSNRKRKRAEDEGISYERPARRRAREGQPSYYIGAENWPIGEDDDQPVGAASRGRAPKSTGAYRSLWDTRGPFGVAGGPPPIRSGPTAGGADSDSSDDEQTAQRPRPSIGGMAGMTPTTGGLPFGFPAPPERAEPTSGPANLGRIKDSKTRADADPLGVDQTVNFDGVGGLDSHVNQLKEMVLLPLLYPELFSRLHVTPPRGVLFHGPPGTGKTLLARALSNSVTSQGKRVTFYMRKGADTLSKYVGEAERQLRLLFEDARKNQPSIIFFDEIDGLAPVRSSKQDQIHATIVTTLLALMDGMDGRGQVIVIGATNRPDTVDSALRRPGRFDREFYFPLPDASARRKIIDIHTKGWEPALQPEFKEQLSSLTNGYGGADLRALCTEAALNAIQGTYPQIYTSMDKLLVDPERIKVLAKDFMISVGKIVPSSQRSTSSSASPLDARVEPLLRDTFQKISQKLDKMLPQRKKLTALEEAQYDDRDDASGFDRELMQQDFDQARVFRPRMLVYGKHGMGQHFIGSALLHKFERLHVQNFDLSVLYGDSARSPQAAVVQLFTEAKRHKPSVIYIPNLELWYSSLEHGVIELFKTSLNALPPNEPILLLATMDLPTDTKEPEVAILRDLFEFSKHSHHHLLQPNDVQRRNFFTKVSDLIRKAPSEFPDPSQRKKRDLPQLEKAPPAEVPQVALTKEQLKALKKSDIIVLNKMKIKINPIMEQLKREFKGFRRPAVEPELISYLFDAADPTKMASDIPVEGQDPVDRPYAVAKDKHGVDVLREIATGKTYYNIEMITIERRLSNGYYKRPKDFFADIKRLHKDTLTLGDPEKILKANIMLSNVDVDLNLLFDESDPGLLAACEDVYLRERERERLVLEKIDRAQAEGQNIPDLRPNIPPHLSTTTTATTGPINMGHLVNGRPPVPRAGNVLDQLRHTPTSNGLSNGVGPSGPSSNGHHAGSGHDSDNEMIGNSQDDHVPILQQPASQPLSQRAAMTPMHPGSQADQYHNSASTTTSGKPSSKSKSSANTQSTPLEDPFLSINVSGASQLPDTQEYNQAGRAEGSPSSTQTQAAAGQASQASPPQLSQGSQGMPPPPARHDTSRQNEKLIITNEFITKFLDEVVKRSSGFSVEQLEQMNATLMDTLWTHRSEWNRNKVVDACTREFNVLVTEMETLQQILEPSQATPDS